MEIKVYSGEYEVLNSGVAFVRYGENLEFLIANLRFKFRIEKNDDAKQKIQCCIATEGNGSFMDIRYFNLNGATLSRLNKPLLLAHFDNRKLTFQFSITSLNKREENGLEKEDAMVIYSWCLEKKKPNTDA